MKHLHSIVLMLALFFATNAMGQTYYYKITYKTDKETGVKSSYTKNIYVTFTDSKRYCYQSDINGSQMGSYDSNLLLGRPHTSDIFIYSCDNVFKFTDTQNDIHRYACDWSCSSLIMPNISGSSGSDYVTFSSDFKKINIHKSGIVYVGQRSTPQGQESSPTELY